MRPIEANKIGNENMVYVNLFRDGKVQIPSKNKFNAGDLVRIDKNKDVFDNGYLSNYTTEVFQIAAVKHNTSIT